MKTRQNKLIHGASLGPQYVTFCCAVLIEYIEYIELVKITFNLIDILDFNPWWVSLVTHKVFSNGLWALSFWHIYPHRLQQTQYIIITVSVCGRYCAAKENSAVVTKTVV